MEITGYTNYLIYDDGRVYNKKFKRLLKPKPEVDHINSIRTDNRLENLQWLTKKENNDKRNLISNTGEKYISYEKKNNRYRIVKKNCFRESLNCNTHTLQDAINLRDALLGLG